MAQFAFWGASVVPTGGGLPTTIDLSAAQLHQIWVFPPGAAALVGEITSIRQVQDPVPVPEPATFTLSALGVAALIARRTTATRLRATVNAHHG